MTSELVPYLSYRDGAGALRFLEQAFGFTTVLRCDDDEGRVQHAEVRLGDAVVMLGYADHPTPSVEDGSVGQGLYLVLDDVDGAFERARAAGARAVFPPEDTEWGTRRARVLDPEGYEWSFGSYRPGSSS